MGFLVTARVESVIRFDEFNRALEVSINKALVEWAQLALTAVISHETRVGDASSNRKISPGRHLRDTFQVATISKLGGFGSLNVADFVVYSDSPNAVWQELGTRGRRKRQLKNYKTKKQGAAFNDTEGNRGVRPLYFMLHGLKASAPQGIALVEAAIAGVGQFDAGNPIIDTAPTSYFNHKY